jgi:hypothetical protein
VQLRRDSVSVIRVRLWCCRWARQPHRPSERSLRLAAPCGDGHADRRQFVVMDAHCEGRPARLARWPRGSGEPRTRRGISRAIRGGPGATPFDVWLDSIRLALTGFVTGARPILHASRPPKMASRRWPLGAVAPTPRTLCRASQTCGMSKAWRWTSARRGTRGRSTATTRCGVEDLMQANRKDVARAEAQINGREEREE